MASNTREVVTFQLGHYANFVGTHWWNIQESSFVYSLTDTEGPKEINHDVLFREGQNLLGDCTFTPRLIAVDLKGSLNTLKQEGQLYDVPTPQHADDLFWGEDVTLHEAQSPQKNEFLQDLHNFENGTAATPDSSSSHESDVEEAVVTDTKEQIVKQYALEDGVSVWSDFLRLHLHPKSIHLLHNYQHENELHRFDMFGCGRQAVDGGVDWDAIDDRIHFFLEECNHIQGVNVLVDIHDGFGGLGTSVLQQLQDDYGIRSGLTYGLMPPSFKSNKSQDHVYRIINSVLALSNLISCDGAFVPLATDYNPWQRNTSAIILPHLQHKSDLWYHTSAILGASIDTTTLPYRLYTHPSLLSHITDALTDGARKLLGLQTSLPFAFRQHSNLYNSLIALGGESAWGPITPLYSDEVDAFAQSVVLRGVLPTSHKGPISQSMPREIQQAKTASEVLEFYLNETQKSCLSAVCSVQRPTKVVAPFPNIFKPEVSAEGHIAPEVTYADQGVSSVPMMTSLQVSPCTVDLVDALVKAAAKVNLKRYSQLLDSDVETDEYEEAVNHLQSLADNYRTNNEGIF